MLTLIVQLAVLVILVSDASTLVPPPENVTVSCNNFKTVVYWNYSEPSRQPFFDLKITGDYRRNSARLYNHYHYDLSEWIWSTDELDRYFVNITANDGTETSRPQVSSLFTFNRDKTAIIYCKLDFPDVHLAMMDKKVIISFNNPYHLYPELKRSHMRLDDRLFHYKVFYENDPNERIHKLECKEEQCGMDFWVPEKKQKYCFSLEGNAMEHRLAFKRKGPICIFHENKNDSWKIYLPIISSLIVLGAIMILTTCWKFWGKQNKGVANFPKSLASLLSNTHGKNCHMHLPFERMSHINSIEPAITKTQSLLEMPEESIPDPQYRNDSEQSEEVLLDNSSLLHTELLLETEGRLPCSVLFEDPMETDLPTLEDIDFPESGYDRKHVVEMSPGDVVTCYGHA